jgi:NAD/NADP transhydrogenase beta subunit
LENKKRRYTEFKKSILMSFIVEILKFINHRKKYWLLPILIILGIFGALIVLSQGSAVAPFIYTLF